MIRSMWAQGEIHERLIEKNRGYKSVYSVAKEDLNKYLSTGCSLTGCGGDIELIHDMKIPELVEGYHCQRCGLTTLYDGYIFHLDG